MWLKISSRWIQMIPFLSKINEAKLITHSFLTFSLTKEDDRMENHISGNNHINNVHLCISSNLTSEWTETGRPDRRREEESLYKIFQSHLRLNGVKSKTHRAILAILSEIRCFVCCLNEQFLVYFSEFCLSIAIHKVSVCPFVREELRDLFCVEMF